MWKIVFWLKERNAYWRANEQVEIQTPQEEPAPSFSVNGWKGVAAVPCVALPAAAVFPPPNAKPDPELAVLLAPNPVFVFPPPKGLLAAAVLPPNGLFCVVVFVAPNPPVFEEPKSPPPLGAAVLLPNPPAAGLLWPKRPPPRYELVAVFVELWLQEACVESDATSLHTTTVARNSIIPSSKFLSCEVPHASNIFLAAAIILTYLLMLNQILCSQHCSCCRSRSCRAT